MKKILVFCTLTLAAASAMAAPLTPSEALGRAIADSRSKIGGKAAQFSLAYTCAENGVQAAYVFTRNNEPGFIVVSGDDIAPALLGYSDAVFADENGEIASGLEYWLQEYGREIAYAAGRQENGFRVAPRTAKNVIAPLCSTKWGQSAPYYNLCPIKNTQRCVTGCAATSTSQMLKYHNWPTTGEGSHTYTWNGYTLTFNYEEKTFDWANMLDTYTGTTTEEQQNAVALLMKGVGYGLDMDYSPTASGATSTSTQRALIENLRYDKSLRLLNRAWYSLYDWENIIYNSLVNYGPVIYNGQSDSGGHSFICDGYAGDGLFHINWGWNGISDGYFLLDALDPYEQGTGGSASGNGFNYSQQILVDLKPDYDGTSTQAYMLASYGSVALEVTSETILTLTSLLYNCMGITIPSGAFGVALTPVDNYGIAQGETEYYGYSFGGSSAEDTGLEPLYGWKDVPFNLADVEEGRYMVRLCFFGPDDEEWPVMVDQGDDNEYILVKSATGMEINPVSQPIPQVAELQFPDTFDDSNSIVVNGTLINPVNSAGSFRMFLVVLNEERTAVLTQTGSLQYAVDADEYKDFSFNGVIGTNDQLQEGYYYPLAFAVSDGNSASVLISEPVDVLYAGESGMNEVVKDTNEEVRTYYNLQGIKVAEAAPGAPTPALAPGLYILRTPTTTTKIAR